MGGRIDRLRILLLLMAVAQGCDEGSAAAAASWDAADKCVSVDGGRLAARDGSAEASAVITPPAPSFGRTEWDGGDGLPPLNWTVPDCVEDYGKIARNILEGYSCLDLCLTEPVGYPGNFPYYGVIAAATRDAVVVRWSEGWGVVQDGRFKPLDPIDDPEGLFIGGDPWPTSAPARSVALGDDGTIYGIGGAQWGPLLVEERNGSRSTRRLRNLPGRDTGGFYLTTQEGRFPVVQPGPGAALRVAGGWGIYRDPVQQFHSGIYSMAGDSGVWKEPEFVDGGFWRVTLDASGDIVGEPERFDPQRKPNPDDVFNGDPLMFLDTGSRAALVMRWGIEINGPLEVVIRDAESGSQRSALIEEPSAISLRDIIAPVAAVDGDMLVFTWLSGILDQPAVMEMSAEASLATGDIVREPTPIQGPLAYATGQALSSHPGGGVDVVKFDDSLPGYVHDETWSMSVPLGVYLGMRRPLSYEGKEPLRLGAGGVPVEVEVVRDGDRLVVVWIEHGPRWTMETTLDGGADAPRIARRRTVQGIFWAVLRCDDL